jgi:hypothetical protein
VSCISLIILAGCAALAIDIQITTEAIIREQHRMRTAIMASQDRCPLPGIAKRCDWHIEARSHGTWARCDTDHPPSGADLPMHRWFRLTGECPITSALTPFGQTIRIGTIPMKIFR